MVSGLANIQTSGLTTLLRTLVFTWGNNVMEKRQHAKPRKESFVSTMWMGSNIKASKCKGSIKASFWASFTSSSLS